MSLISEPNDPTPSGLIGRRRIIGNLGMASISLLAGSSLASAFSPNRSSDAPSSNVPSPSFDLPDEWMEHNSSAGAYYKFLQSLKLQRVDAQQALESHAKERGGVWNSLPPRVWWKRMGYVLKVVDRIALEMNVNDVEVISAYRSPAYNARCRGAKSGSWHKVNVAADVKFPVRPSKVAATARELRNLGLFSGGVGGYWNFTHIDARGQNVDW